MKKKKAIPASELEQMSQQRLREEQVVQEREPDLEEAATIREEEETSFEDLPWEEEAVDLPWEEETVEESARETVQEEEPREESGAGDPRVDLILNSVDELLGGVIYRWERIEQIVMRVLELVMRVYQLQAIVVKTLETGHAPVEPAEIDEETKGNLLGMLKTFLEGLEQPTS
ncbi:MAG: hypothetical protein GX182_02945 [Firmicutes bacterium]|jgi:hypothetical protein|nr:hypothetical protein [Bacillota bacterium]